MLHGLLHSDVDAGFWDVVPLPFFHLFFVFDIFTWRKQPWWGHSVEPATSSAVRALLSRCLSKLPQFVRTYDIRSAEMVAGW